MPPLTSADDQVAQTPFGGVVVRRHVRFGHAEDLDMALDASAQSGGWGGRVVEERLTDGEQGSFQARSGAPSLGLGMGARVGGGRPQHEESRVEGAQVVAVAPQVSPAALLGAVVVGGIEIADQHAGE